MENAAEMLRGWSDYAAGGGLDGPPGEVPGELLDMDDRVSAEVPALIGVVLAIHAAGRPEAARTVLSLAAKTALNSPDAVAKTVPLAAGLAKWAGAGRDTILRGMGCVTAMCLIGSGAKPPGGGIGEMVRDGSAWTMGFPGGESPTMLETLGGALASYAFPNGAAWADLTGGPDAKLFTAWAAYLYGGGLDRPIDSVDFALLGGTVGGGQLVDIVTSSVISAAICLAAHGRGEAATELLAAMEAVVREANGDIDKLSLLTATKLGSLGGLASQIGDRADGATGCFTALALWQTGVLRCLDPGHTLRKMAMSQTTRFATDRNVYEIGEFSRMQDRILRGLQRGGDERDDSGGGA